MEEREKEGRVGGRGAVGGECVCVYMWTVQPEWESFCGASAPPFGETWQSSPHSSPPHTQHTSRSKEKIKK